MLAETPMTSPGHYIIGGLSGNEGIVISRDEDNTVHRDELTDDKWFVVGTNVDFWEVKDARYELAVQYLEELRQENVQPDGKTLVENVLWKEGVILDLSIFSAVISANPDTEVEIYDTRSHYLSNFEPLF